MKKFILTPMVYDHIDKTGIWWKGPKDGLMYVFYWNPLRVIYSWITNTICFGFLPFESSHLR
jgi:hypothetical protein